ncbi:glycosyltransferase family 2 protein [bacterium]|nr:glycosyltransferase family 2 protein [bacterium]
MKPDLTIIICSYNEIGRIEQTYVDLLQTLELRQEKPEIFFIDNGSTDGTREWLSKIEHPDVQVIFNEHNLGKGGSLKKGIGLSTGNYVVVHDSDFEYRAADVWKCYDQAESQKASLVLGGRFANGRTDSYHLVNYLGVRFLTLLINILYGCWIKDSASAIKLFKGDILRSINLESDGFELDFELVARVARIGGKVLEVPAAFYPRTSEEGKKVRAFSDGFASLKVILKNRFLPQSMLLK